MLPFLQFLPVLIFIVVSTFPLSQEFQVIVSQCMILFERPFRLCSLGVVEAVTYTIVLSHAYIDIALPLTERDLAIAFLCRDHHAVLQ